MILRLRIWKELIMIRNIKSLYWNVQRVIKWIPVIWRDREFDHTYFLQIISFKLKQMEEFYYSKYAISADRGDCAEKIRICRLLCDRLIKDEYHDMLGEKIRMYTIPITENGYKYSRVEFEILEKGCQLGICKRWAHYEDYMQKQDLKYLCKLLEKHLRSWWD